MFTADGDVDDAGTVDHRSAGATTTPADLLCCRACQAVASPRPPDTGNLIDLGAPQNRSLLRKLRTCVDTHIDIADGRLPRHLCAGCAASVEAAHRFRIRCEYIDQQWRDSLLLLRPAAPADDVRLDTPAERYEEASVERLEVADMSAGDEAVVVERLDEADMFATIGSMLKEEVEEAEAAEYTQDTVHDNDEVGEFIVEYIESENRSDEETLEELVPAISEGECEDEQSQLEEYIDDSTVAGTLLDEHFEESSGIAAQFSLPFIADADRFQCDTCAVHLPTIAALNEHKKSHGKQRFQCPTCEKWFSKRYHLKNHQTIHDEHGVQYPCSECDKSYTNRGNLDRHVRVFHRQQRAYTCPECGKSFSQSGILNQHRTLHTTALDWACDMCNKRFKTREYLQLHRKRHAMHPASVRMAKATTTTTTKPPNNADRTAPKGARPAASASRRSARPKKICHCQYCGKQSNSVSLHVSHMRTHTGEKPYECELCQKRFSFQQSLKTHRLMHSGEKPHRCDECGQRFRQIGHLTGHRLTHSGRRQHACSYCPKTFALRGNLTVHMRMHTGETPYRCDYCGKKFNDSNGLKRHVVVHDREASSGVRCGVVGAGHPVVGGVHDDADGVEEDEDEEEEEEEEDMFSYSDVIAYESDGGLVVGDDGDAATTAAASDEQVESGVVLMIMDGDLDGGDEAEVDMHTLVVGDDSHMQDGYSVAMLDMS